MIKEIDGFSKEPGFRSPSKFTNSIDDFIFKETHEARAELWEKVKGGCRTSQRLYATRYNIREIILDGKKIIYKLIQGLLPLGRMERWMMLNV